MKRLEIITNQKILKWQVNLDYVINMEAIRGALESYRDKYKKLASFKPAEENAEWDAGKKNTSLGLRISEQMLERLPTSEDELTAVS